MTPTTQTTKSQERTIYRKAVQASLETFYGKSKPEAKRLVKGWWNRLSESDAFDSELFLHSEPINTAAGIADVRAVPITSANRQTYHRILNRSRDKVLAPQPETKRTNAEPEKRLVYVAARKAAATKLGKKTTKKSAAKQRRAAAG